MARFRCYCEPVLGEDGEPDNEDAVEIDARDEDDAAEIYARRDYDECGGGFESTDVWVVDEDGEQTHHRATVEIVERWDVRRVVERKGRGV